MIDLSLFEGHTPAPWWWGEWCETLFGIPPHHDGDYEYHDDTQTIFVMNTNKTPICPSFYQWENGQDLHMKGEERWGVVSRKAWPEESLRNNALRSEDAMLIAYAPKLLAEVKQLRERLEVIEDFINDELRAFVNSNTFDHIYDAIEKKLEVIE